MVAMAYGYSAATPIKQKTLRKVMDMYLPKLARKFSKTNDILVIDAAAGPGKHGRSLGSPLVILNSLDDNDISAYMYALEGNRARHDDLVRNITAWKARRRARQLEIEVIRADNGKTTKDILESWAEYDTVGVYYLDASCIPNFDLLLAVEKQNPELCLLFTVGVSTCKRHHVDVQARLAEFEKRWYTNPYNSQIEKSPGMQKWHMIMGVPKDDPVTDEDMAKIGFFPVAEPWLTEYGETETDKSKKAAKYDEYKIGSKVFRIKRV